MNSKTFLIIAGLAAAGIAAYFIFKPKKVIKENGVEIIID